MINLSAGLGFYATPVDVTMVNGGYQPIIRIPPGIPQLWRIINASFKVPLLSHLQFLFTSQCRTRRACNT